MFVFVAAADSKHKSHEKSMSSRWWLLSSHMCDERLKSFVGIRIYVLIPNGNYLSVKCKLFTWRIIINNINISINKYPKFQALCVETSIHCKPVTIIFHVIFFPSLLNISPLFPCIPIFQHHNLIWLFLCCYHCPLDKYLILSVWHSAF